MIDAASVVNIAQIFLDFLNGGADVKAQPAPVATPAEKPVKAAKATLATGTKATTAVTPKPAKPAPVTAEEVLEDRKAKIGAKVAASLAANKRQEAVDIMAEYGAQSVSSLAASDASLAEVLAKFDEMLLAA